MPAGNRAPNLAANDVVDALAGESATVAAAVAGDEAAIRAIYMAHAPAVTRRLLNLCGDATLAEELAQDAFVTAFDRLDRFAGDSCLATWLHGIAFNHLRNRRAGDRRRSRLHVAARQTLARVTAEPADADARRRDLLARFDDALAQLDFNARSAFVLRVVEQLPLAEVASILDSPVSTVSHWTRRAEAKVRVYLEEHEA